MSIRTDARGDLSQAMQQTLHIDASVMQQAAAAAGNPLMPPAQTPTAAVMGDSEQHLAAANEFNTNNPDHPLKRSVAINIRASLSDLCLRKQKAVWQPGSAEATKSIFSQKKFVDLAGTAEQQGDLKERPSPAIPPHFAPLSFLSLNRLLWPLCIAVGCAAQPDDDLAEVDLPDRPRRPHHRRRRFDLLRDGRVLLDDHAAERGHPHLEGAAGGRHRAR
jgi:hypothetical protein